MTPAASPPTVAIVRARDLATPATPVAKPEDSAGDVRQALAGATFDSAVDIAVVSNGRFAGLVPIERLLAARRDSPIGTLTETSVTRTDPDTAVSDLSWSLGRPASSSIAVVGSDGGLVGLIAPSRLIPVLIAEHDEDIARLGGYLASTGRARSAAEEPVSRRLLHRLPWLLLGLAGAMFSVALVGSYEHQLEAMALLAFFVPAVVYMADAVGTQTEAVVIRGMSVGVEWRRVVLRELISGALIGLLVGAAFLAFATIAYGNTDLALGVGLALFASCAIATVVAMSLPWLLQRAGLDPAFGAGPVATVIQDLLSLVVYFAVAVPIAT